MVFEDPRLAELAGHDGRIFRRMIVALAIFADSPASRVIGNIFLTVNKPIFPTRIFTDEGDALDWLEDYVEVI